MQHPLVIRFRMSRTAFVLCCLIVVAGCNDHKSAPADTGTESAASAATHEHHHEPLGPNGGHLIALEPPDYQAEWTHEDDTITVFILDQDAKQESAIEASEIKITTVVGDATIQYRLPAVHALQDDPPKASRFQLESANLMTALSVGTGVDARLNFTTGAVTYSGKIEHHQHSHGHHHH